MEKRRRFLIDKKIQFSFLKFIVCILMLISCFFGFFLVRINNYLTDYILVSVQQSSHAAIKPTGRDSLGQFKEELDRKDRLFFFQVVLTILVLGFAVSFWTIRYTHRIAGPVYHITRVIDQAMGGDLSVRIHLRKKDLLKDLAQKINDLFAYLEKK